ncbi:hypothetical protein [Streptomyces soliscabiei]|uniref:hypothetical protein n=1 Tax=Streptomyces soliscabiei TaxID=588897 RepID=UPI0029A0AD43|nr:hypothetical protein [Streptomyces sp. NY05-11A]MDX2683684.1 hypothetical protein [Streptomyces sp. NY05-11A]
MARWSIGGLGKFFSPRVPKAVSAQAAMVRDNLFGGNTAKMAQAYNVNPRTVQRWIDGSRGKKLDPKTLRQLESDAKAAKITPTGMKRRATQLRKNPAAPAPADLRVKFHGDLNTSGGSPMVNTKNRPFTLDLSNDQAARLLEASASGDEPAQREVIAEALSENLYGAVDVDPDSFGPGDYSIT